jgi:sulfatase modifying factor 1
LEPPFRRRFIAVWLALAIAAGAAVAIAACGGRTREPARPDDAGVGQADAPGAAADAAGVDLDAPSSSTDGPAQDAGPPPCPATCGPDAGQSCCASLPVAGGTFYRSYDGTTCDALSGVCFNQKTWPATVSSFRLDRYEVTVGRYLPFVAAVEGGWVPAAGSGKHSHLNGGRGVVDGAADAGVAYETGWDPSWNAVLDSSISAPDAYACPEQVGYTPSPGPDANRPVMCVTWWAAYAFCIWDGGFLPTEAEWNYAASGGTQQRVYPWGPQAIDCTYANFDWCVLGDAGVDWSDNYESVAGAYSPRGDGLFGQSDLVGNVSEWTLDYWSNYVTPCVDCGYLDVDPAFGVQRTERGASYDQAEPYITPVVSERGAREPQIPLSTGIRCARAP